MTTSKPRALPEPAVTPPGNNVAPAHAPPQLYTARETSVASVLMHPIHGAHSTAVVTIPVHRMISLPSVQAEIIHGAALATHTVAFTHLGTACFHLQYNFNPRLSHIHIHTRSHNSIYNHNHILWHNFNHLHIYSKLFNIPAISHQQNPKLQKQFPLHPQKFKKIYFHPVVPVATLYLLVDQIAGVEIGGSGGDLGGFGSRTRTFAMCGGGHL